REDAARPAIEIVVLEAVPQIRADFGFRGNLMQRNPALDAQPPKIGSECFPRAHGRPEDCARTCPPRMSRRDGVSLTEFGTCGVCRMPVRGTARSVVLQPITFSPAAGLGQMPAVSRIRAGEAFAPDQRDPRRCRP